MFEYIIQLDQFLVLEASKFHNQYLDILMIFLTKIGDFGFLWIFLTVFLVLWKKYRSIGYIFLFGMSIDILLGEGILKHIFYRLRPFQEMPNIILEIQAPITSSFPSGHSSASWCFAIIFTYFFWKISRGSVIFIWILAIGIIISRVYLQVHYPSDILGGICVGVISAILAILLYTHRSRNSKSK